MLQQLDDLDRVLGRPEAPKPSPIDQQEAYWEWQMEQGVPPDFDLTPDEITAMQRRGEPGPWQT